MKLLQRSIERFPEPIRGSRQSAGARGAAARRLCGEGGAAGQRSRKRLWEEIATTPNHLCLILTATRLSLSLPSGKATQTGHCAGVKPDKPIQAGWEVRGGGRVEGWAEEVGGGSV